MRDGMSHERAREKERPSGGCDDQQGGGENRGRWPEEGDAARGKAEGEPDQATEVVRGRGGKGNREFRDCACDEVTELLTDIACSNVPQDVSVFNVHVRLLIAPTCNRAQSTADSDDQLVKLLFLIASPRESCET